MNREKLSYAIGLIDDDILDEYDKRNTERAPVNAHSGWKKGLVVAACAVLLLFAATGIAWAASEEFRGALAQFLHIDIQQTHAVGASDTDEGIKITVVSTHSNEDVSVILLSIEKTDGGSFQYRWNPGGTAFTSRGKTLSWRGSVLTTRSEDEKTLFCYITALFDDPADTVTLQIDGLDRMESMTAGDTDADMVFAGNWSVSFPLKEDENDTIKLANPASREHICAFYRDLQVDAVSLSGTCAVLDATVLKRYEISDEQLMKDMLSSYSTFHSGYYGVWLQLNFKDGSISKYDMIYTEDAAGVCKLTAFFMEYIDMDAVESIQMGDLTIPLK